MQCLTCHAEIPPQWVNAIQRNECPGCGGPIMDDASKELLTELKEAMGKMPNDPEGLAGWLLSNYTLTKIGAAEPTEFHRKPTKAEAKGRKLKIAKNSVQDFLRRKNPKMQKDLATIAQQISSGEVDEEMYGDGEELDPEGLEVGEEEYEEVDLDEMDPEEEATFNRRNFKSKAKNLAKHSLLLPGTRPLSAEETATMMESVAGEPGADIEDDNIPEVLQKSRRERLMKQQAIGNGMQIGSFSRRS